MSAPQLLFACSKCFARHPFEELSSGQQLCKVNINNRSNTINLKKKTYFVSIEVVCVLFKKIPILCSKYFHLFFRNVVVHFLLLNVRIVDRNFNKQPKEAQVQFVKNVNKM